MVLERTVVPKPSRRPGRPTYFGSRRYERQYESTLASSVKSEKRLTKTEEKTEEIPYSHAGRGIFSTLKEGFGFGFSFGIGIRRIATRIEHRRNHLNRPRCKSSQRSFFLFHKTARSNEQLVKSSRERAKKRPFDRLKAKHGSNQSQGFF